MEIIFGLMGPISAGIALHDFKVKCINLGETSSPLINIEGTSQPGFICLFASCIIRTLMVVITLLLPTPPIEKKDDSI